MNDMYNPLIDWHLSEANRLANKDAKTARNSNKIMQVPDGDCALVRTKDKIFIVARKGRDYHTKDFICIGNLNKKLFWSDAPSGTLVADVNDDGLAERYMKWSNFMDRTYNNLKEKYNNVH